MDKFVGGNEMFDSVTSLSLHVFGFAATLSSFVRYHRGFRHKHEGFADPLF